MAPPLVLACLLAAPCTAHALRSPRSNFADAQCTPPPALPALRLCGGGECAGVALRSPPVTFDDAQCTPLPALPALRLRGGGECAGVAPRSPPLTFADAQCTPLPALRLRGGGECAGVARRSPRFTFADAQCTPLPALRLRGGGEYESVAAGLAAGLHTLTGTAFMTAAGYQVQSYVGDGAAPADALTILRYYGATELALAAVVLLGHFYGVDEAAVVGLASLAFVMLSSGLDAVGLSGGLTFLSTFFFAGLSLAQYRFDLSPYIATAVFAAGALEAWFGIRADLNILSIFFDTDIRKKVSPLSRALLKATGSNYAMTAVYLFTLAYTDDRITALLALAASNLLACPLNLYFMADHEASGYETIFSLMFYAIVAFIALQ